MLMTKPEHPASLPDRSPLDDRFHIVLAEPGDSLNIGSVARAMSNLGFSRLHLVAPPRYNMGIASTTACWATDILESAVVHDTLEEALAPMQKVVGFTARHGKHRHTHLSLPQWVGEVRTAPPAATALLFGPEDTGLRTDHVEHCRWLVRIPSSAANPSFNLAQSVLLTLFELTRTDWEEATGNGKVEPGKSLAPPKGELANSGEFYQLDRLVEEALTRSNFYGKGTPAPMRGLVKHLLRRIGPDKREMAALVGIFDHINRVLAGRAPAQPFLEKLENPQKEK